MWQRRLQRPSVSWSLTVSPHGLTDAATTGYYKYSDAIWWTMSFSNAYLLSLCVSWREYQKSLHLTAHLWYLFHVEYWVSTEALKGQLDKNRWINDIINTDFQTSFYCPVKMCKTQLDFIFIVIKTAALLILIVELMFLMLISFLFSHSSILRSECRNQVPRGLQTARSLVLKTP